jgi:hypothetical protein
MKKYNVLITIIVLLTLLNAAMVFTCCYVMDKAEEFPEPAKGIEVITEVPTESETVVPEATSTPVTEPVVETTAIPEIIDTEPTIPVETTIPIETTVPVETTVPIETDPIEEIPVEPEFEIIIDEVPLYNQWNYPDVYYGQRANVSVATHGDGMTTLAMVATYLKDDPTLTPDVIAKRFGHYDSNQGTSWTLFTESAKELGLGEVRQEFDWNLGGIEEALRAGQLVVCCQGPGVFTETGHYILLYGITEDGKILVRDSNGYNYKSPFLKAKFENGFEPKSIYGTALSYWIYPVKGNSE